MGKQRTAREVLKALKAAGFYKSLITAKVPATSGTYTKTTQHDTPM
ncbi:hypothetical protein [Paenibacillus sp. FSL W8-0194]